MSYYPPNQQPPGSPYNPGNPGVAGYAPGQQQLPYFPPPPGAQGGPPPPPPPPPAQQPVNAAPAIPARPPGYETPQTYLTPHPPGHQQAPQPQPQWTSNIAGRQYQVHYAPPPKSPTRPPELPPRPTSAAPPSPGAYQGYSALPSGPYHSSQPSHTPYGYNNGYPLPPPPPGPPPAQSPSPYPAGGPGSSYPPPLQGPPAAASPYQYQLQPLPGPSSQPSTTYQAPPPPPPGPPPPQAASPYPGSSYQTIYQPNPASYQPPPPPGITSGVISPDDVHTPGRSQGYPQYSPGIAELGPSISVSSPPADANATSQPSQPNNAFVHSITPTNPAQPKPSKPVSAVENIISFTSPSPPTPAQLSQGVQEGSAARHDIEGVTNAFQSMKVGFDPRTSMPPPPPPPQPQQPSLTGSVPIMPGDNQHGANNPTPPQHGQYQEPQAQTYPPPPTQQPTEGVNSHGNSSAPLPSAGPPPGPPPPDQLHRADYTTPTHAENTPQGHGPATTKWTPRNDWDRRYEKYGIKTLPVCIGSAVPLKTTWYTHQSAPSYLICSRCYVDHIYPTRFKDDFKGEELEADKAHICRFPTLRVKKELFPQVVTTGDLQPFLDYANARLGLPECKGAKGAKGSEGIKWWRAKNDAIPGLVICETCVEDMLKSSPFMAKFEPATGQGEEDIWSCDLALPYLARVLQKTRETGDWTAFMEAANLRIQLQAAQPCPRLQHIPTENRNFYTPLQGPRHLTICECCYLDRVKDIDGMDSQWFRSTKREEKVPGEKASCDMVEPNILMLMIMADEREDPSLFFTALAKLTAEPHCGLEGVKTKRWYTLPSDPAGFGVCGACYEGTVEPWGISRFLKPKPGWAADGEAHLCALSAGHARFESMGRALLRTFFAGDAAQWDEYAGVYAAMPRCTRDSDCRGREWYGWPECTICPECYHEFCRGTALEAQMPWRRKLLTGYSMCEMYSPRMRGMYAEACGRTPPDATELRRYSDRRRVVYANTIVRCREMVNEQRMALVQQQMLNQQSLFYTQLGRNEVNTIGSHHTYSQAGVVGTFRSQWELDGARYGQQANEVMRNATRPGKAMMVAELERQWRAVE
ncbi:uncharacterized protein E0L32_012078 [Thyridium curvatum]|uniref:Integral membrane protein n=1 Tax=Thyridium curvatum TaxID=1093900 RepID=A0A507BDS4_9PEZI|nr:uncharacterized protein E0L32_012078 [Thyridium curvatum]TPX17633.1 hypothetical protein E0L32_012078 [Thyridium curvatum]